MERAPAFPVPVTRVPPPADPPSGARNNDGGHNPFWNDGLCLIMCCWPSASGEANTIAIERAGERTWFVHRIIHCEKHWRGRWMRLWQLPKGMLRRKLESLPHRCCIEQRVISYGEARCHAEAQSDLPGMEHRLGLLEWKPAPEHLEPQQNAFKKRFIYRDETSAGRHDGSAPASFDLGNGVN